MAKGIAERYSNEAEEPVRTPEPEALMGVLEFGVTCGVNRTLFAGFAHYCKSAKVPPRLTEKDWKRALTNWQNAPAT